ncbi:MAG: SulP family inorganic anion transporter [Acidobacteria bacterium]|nr:SulP family inorganic anion transporter [Acidobacteriota bacterium]MCY3964363.1 SulP family inorganic anion transporter [Acidobacteriota bacterium]
MRYDIQTFRGDLFGALTSTVVALPVALALGVASGMGAVAGLHGAIAVGFFAAVFGGTRSQISGPTAPMTVAMTVIITTHASNLTEALTVVVLGGLLQLLLGLAKIGRYVIYTPYVVVSGFMSGIGIIVILIQILPILGSSPAPGGPTGAIRAIPEAVGAVNLNALAVGLLTLAVGVLWPKRLAKYLPGPLLALIVGTLLGVFWLGGAPVLGDVPAGLPSLKIGIPAAGFLVQALQPALILALLGSVDSLLTSLVADSLTGTRHNPNRELVGQGIGNMVSGMLGGLPGAGATMGTVVNIRAGGSTPVSGALRATFLLLLAVGLGPVVEPVPHAVLAAIMMKVGWDIIDWPLVARVHRIRREHLFVMLLTLGLTVLVDLVTAVAVGLIAAGMAHARRLERLELDSVVSVPLLDRTFFAEEHGPPAADRYSARVGLVALKGTLTVASSNKLVGVIGGDIKDHEVVIFDFSEAVHLDDSAAMLIRRLFEVASAERTEVVVAGLSGSVARTLHTLDILRGIPEDRLTPGLEEARAVAHDLLNGPSGTG